MKECVNNMTKEHILEKQNKTVVTLFFVQYKQHIKISV